MAILERKEPDAWTTFQAQALLGTALAGQKKYAEAEPLLLRGYEGMKQRADRRDKPGGSPPPERLTEALDRLIELYTVMNKSDEVKKWQTERAKYKTEQDKSPQGKK